MRRRRADEAGALRDVRLRALREAPEAFWSTCQREATFGGEERAARSRRSVFRVSDEVPAAAALDARLGFVPTGRVGPGDGRRRYADAVLEL